MIKFKVTIVDKTGTFTEEEKKELEEQIKKELENENSSYNRNN